MRDEVASRTHYGDGAGSQRRGATMADKSPKKDNAKKAGKSLKEKRAEKNMKTQAGRAIGSCSRLSDGAEAVDDAPHREERQHPQHRVDPPVPDRDRGAQQDRLHEQDLRQRAPHLRIVGAEARELVAEEPDPGSTGRVARQLAPEA